MSEQVFAIARDVAMGIVTVLVFYWGRDRKQVAEAVEAQFKIRDREIASCHDELRVLKDIVKELMDDVHLVASRMDRLPEDLRTKFLPLDRAADLIDESRRDRAAIWSAVRGRPGARRSDYEPS